MRKYKYKVIDFYNGHLIYSVKVGDYYCCFLVTKLCPALL